VARPGLGDINNLDTSAVGWIHGEALIDESVAMLDEFIGELASGELNLFTGPLNFQDGSAYLADGEAATDLQIWYTPQLLEGIEGASAPE
jgi:simple sugar transport system substrate-binding protein